MKRTNVLFALAFVAMIFLTAATFIANRFLFADQPDMENVMSLVWTVALGVVLYKMLRFAFGPQPLSPRERQQNIYGALIFLIELVAVVTMVIISIMFVSTLTSPSVENTALPLATAIIGLMALSIPAFGHFFRQAKQRKAREALQPLNTRRN